MSGAAGRLRILYVCGSDFSSPGEKQFLGFAQGLAERGHEVMMSVNGDLASASAEGADQIPGLSVRAHEFAGRGLSSPDLAAASDFGPDVIHALNARVMVAAAAKAYAAETGAPVAVHFEDNEWGYMRGVPGSSRLRLAAQAGRRAVSRVRPRAWYYATRASLRWAREQAAFDALTPALAREVEARMGRECRVILPVLPTPDRSESPSGPGIPAEMLRGGACTFTGALFPQTLDDVNIAMRAIAAVQRRGIDATFVHVGTVLDRLDVDQLAREAGLAAGSWAFLGYRPFSEMPALLEQSDVLLSPGGPTEQNRLRLPSKVQAYLASGTPTVTFAVGFGELVEDRVEVMKTYTADPAELAAVLYEMLTDEELRQALSTGGRAAAKRLFDRDTNVSTMETHYRAMLS